MLSAQATLLGMTLKLNEALHARSAGGTAAAEALPPRVAGPPEE
jgi:hypothetical protein